MTTAATTRPPRRERQLWLSAGIFLLPQALLRLTWGAYYVLLGPFHPW